MKLRYWRVILVDCGVHVARGGYKGGAGSAAAPPCAGKSPLDPPKNPSRKPPRSPLTRKIRSPAPGNRSFPLSKPTSPLPWPENFLAGIDLHPPWLDS